MTEEEILKELIGDDNDDDNDDDDDDDDDEDLGEDKEEEQCATGSVVMSALGTLAIFGMFNDTSVKDVSMALTCKIDFINKSLKADLHKTVFCVFVKKAIRNLETNSACLLCFTF